MKIVRRDLSQGAGKAEQKLDTDELQLDRLVYRKMGSRTDNRSIVTPLSADSDFHRWLLDMNNLYDYKYYPTMYSGPIPTPDITALDEYLGSLGLIEEYPFKEDTFELDEWVNIHSQPEYRYLVDESDKTFLTDSNSTEVLVVYSTRG